MRNIHVQCPLLALGSGHQCLTHSLSQRNCEDFVKNHSMNVYGGDRQILKAIEHSHPKYYLITKLF